LYIDYQEIRRLYNLGFTVKSISEQTGVGIQNIYKWMKRNGLKPNKNKVITVGKKHYKPRKAEIDAELEAKARFFTRSLVWANDTAKEQGKKLNIDNFIDYWRDDGEHMKCKVMGL